MEMAKQHDPSFIPDFVNALTTNGTDIVIGSRFLEKKKKKSNKNNSIPKFYKYKILGMKVLNILTNIAGNVKTSDSQSGFRAYSRKAIEKLNVNNPGMGAGSEILTQLKDLNLNIVEIPISTRYDVKNGLSKTRMVSAYTIRRLGPSQRSDLCFISVFRFSLRFLS
jgi:hypothetical protein